MAYQGFIQPKQASGSVATQGYNFKGAADPFINILDKTTTFMQNQRAQNQAFMDSINERIREYDPREVERMQPQIEAFEKMYSDAAGQFNVGIAQPRNMKERQLRSQLDAMARDIDTNLSFATVMNPRYEEQRMKVLANPTKYSMATVDFYKDPNNWYGKAPLDRNVVTPEEMTDLGGEMDSILQDKWNVSSYNRPVTTTLDDGTIVHSIETREGEYLYRNKAELDALSKEMADDKTLEPSFKQHFDNMLYATGQLGLMANPGSDEYKEEYEAFKINTARKHIENINKTENRLIGTKVVKTSDPRDYINIWGFGGDTPEEEYAVNFYKGIAKIANGDPTQFSEQPLTEKTIRDPKTGVPLLISNAYNGIELGPDEKLGHFYMNPVTGEVLFSKTDKYNRESEPAPLKDVFTEIGMAHKNTLPSSRQKDFEVVTEKLFYPENGARPGISAILSPDENARIAKAKRELTTTERAKVEKVENMMKTIEETYVDNNVESANKLISEGLTFDFISSEGSTYRNASIRLQEKPGFLGMESQLEFDIIDENGNRVITNLSKEELLTELKNTMYKMTESVEAEKPAANENTTTGADSTTTTGGAMSRYSKKQ